MSWAQRKKAMMMQTAVGPEPLFEYVIGNFLGNSGQKSQNISYSACAGLDAMLQPTIYAVSGGETLRHIGPATYDGTALNLYLHEYTDGGGWLRRTQITDSVNTVTFESSTRYICVNIAFPAAAGKAMTQTVIDACGQFEWT